MNSHLHEVWVERMRALSHPLAPIATGWAPRLRPLTGVKAVVFDVYGTLVISASGDIDAAQQADRERCFQESARSVGQVWPAGALGKMLELIRCEHARARTAGVDFPEVDIRKVWSAAALELGLTPLDEAQASALAIEYEGRVNPVWSMPGFPAVLDALRGRFLLGIASNAQFYTPLMLEALAGRCWANLGFEDVLCAWSFMLGRAKPSTELLAGVLARLQVRGVTPEQVVMVGNDFTKDIAPAQKLGCRTVLFAGDQRSLRADALKGPDPADPPDAIVTHLDQLAGLMTT